ncbi:MAG: hypothetical protein IKV10_03440 [Alphaproteobacteria bacterium]|nr:hypothetical protein [Alphaproteobacteria bacterium]
MSSILSRNQKVAPKKKTRQEYAEDALYREVWEDVNNEKTLKFIKKYYRHLIMGALVIMIVATGIQIGVRHVATQKMHMAQAYETALESVDANNLAHFADDASGATADLALFQAYLLDGDIAKLERLADDGNTRDFRDLARLHIVNARGDEMSAADVEKYLSDLDTKNSPFYYTASLTVAQKYLSDGNRDAANKWLDKILNDKDAPVSIVGMATTLR